jgi:predicted transcriptional regulator
MRDLSREIELTDDLKMRILRHFKKYGADYAKSIGRDLEMNKRDVCEILKKLFSEGYIEKRNSGMLKRKEARLKKRVVTTPHHTYYVLSEKGRQFLREEEGIK